MTTDDLRRIDRDTLKNSLAIRELANGLRNYSQDGTFALPFAMAAIIVSVIALAVAGQMCAEIYRLKDEIRKGSNEGQIEIKAQMTATSMANIDRLFAPRESRLASSAACNAFSAISLAPAARRLDSLASWRAASTLSTLRCCSRYWDPPIVRAIRFMFSALSEENMTKPLC